MKLDEYLAQVKERAEKNTPPDCGDNSCRYAPVKSGMRTNGGCRCYRDNNTESRHYVMRLHESRTNIPRLLEIIDTMREALEVTTHKNMDPVGPAYAAMEAAKQALAKCDEIVSGK